MYSSNVVAWELWSTLSRFDRPVGFDGYLNLTISIMSNMCELYDASKDDLTKMIAIEEVMYPVIKEKSKAAEAKERD